jgi:type IVB pilus formation R64 PilN family outer membrane protein
MKKLLVSSLVTLMLSGCMTQTIKETEKAINSDIDEAAYLLEDAGNLKLREVPDVVESSSAWIPTESVQEKRYSDPRLSKSFSINRKLRSINEGAQRIALLTGIPVNVNDDVRDDNDDEEEESVDSLDPFADGGTVDLETTISSLSENEMDAVYSGTLEGFLDVFTTHYNVSWEFRNNKISIFKYKTESFIIKTIPGNTSSAADIGSSGEGSIQGGSNSDDLNIWTDLRASVDTILSKNGQAFVSPSIGTLTVTDTPDTLDRVRRFINDQNDHLKKQAVINIRILSVNLNDEDSYGINWELVNQSLRDSLQLGVTSGDPLTVTSSAITLSKLATGTVLNSGETVSTGSDLQGSSLLIEALSEQGKVSSLTNVTEVTMNNQPAPLYIGRTQGYLASSSVTPSVTPGIAPTTELEQDVIESGFTMNILPHIIDDNALILQYAFDMSRLLGLSSITSGGSSIQTPEEEVRKILQRVMMSSGETTILAGYENNESSFGGSGIGSSKSLLGKLFGGGNTSSNNKNILVVMITPTIISNSDR